ncbi:bifunctional glutamate N-acetyltransferase/amino-acid acetyltransferase ArgJ [Sulfurovum sp. XGS-02]|uniref:bifunctional glutamate N-acetyltransferase/amino-acid acetyltransferase ArgJ n=1 Tax=Sulfurovum sp. XGS-02 TaxID=2925411 RepID=UPI002048882A|nr:bifunctional glutamate N-acetyltransferase/amino-acid acetyltransferase ArgJ [Sulfurovum sp. XGS-02]UPT77321.1 bifunctional glutamate N-acetyltransferase/amino-acid acetyltransferase ArgJ [Sulfurovum sp. XGS-02]
MYKLIPLENGLENVAGFFCGATNVGMRKQPADSNASELDGDVAFIRSEQPCDISAVFTSNTFQAAPIKHFQKYPKGFQTDFVLINAKNANAMTGDKGIEDIESIMSTLSSKQNVLNPVMSSTGVIGYRLPIEKITSAFDRLDFNASNSHQAARAIMTTDSFKKEMAYKVVLANGNAFNIAAICKGAGMINPAMATMLCFIITDANIPKSDMDELLTGATEGSFNRISVDGDTSTNDTVMLLSNRQSAHYDKAAFAEALNKIMFELAMLILKDGEGANKLVAFEVKGAKSEEDAKRASMALSNSLLVKTALFGEDPNWGRIASTIGASGIACDDETLTIHYDDLLIYSSECRELDQVREEKAYEIMKQEHFKVTCDIGLGDASYTSYGCDLSYEYVKINAEYRT